MASFKIIFVLALFAVAMAVEEVRDKRGVLGYGGYYGGLGGSVLPYGYGLGLGNLGYHGYGLYNHGLGGHYYY
uniref:Putative neuropeptide-like protein 31 n=1 Tax=Panstrongylus lignarius TaxID=156445 RepID=A0A224Y4C0_9HEMI